MSFPVLASVGPPVSASPVHRAEVPFPSVPVAVGEELFYPLESDAVAALLGAKENVSRGGVGNHPFGGLLPEVQGKGEGKKKKKKKKK